MVLPVGPHQELWILSGLRLQITTNKWRFVRVENRCQRGPRWPYTTGGWWIDAQISRKRLAVRIPALKSPLTWQEKTSQVVECLLCWPVGLLSHKNKMKFRIYKKRSRCQSFQFFLVFVFLLIRKGPEMCLYEIYVDLHDPWRVFTCFNLVYDIRMY